MEKPLYINLEVKVEDVKNILMNQIDSPHSNIIADVIIDNLMTTSIGVSQLFMAFNGLSPNTSYELGDLVLYEFDSIGSWNIDKSLMELNNMVHQGFIKGVITNINLQNAYPISVTYTGYDKSGIKKDFIDIVKEKYIQLDNDDFLE